MMVRDPNPRELLRLRALADYQFGGGAGACMFRDGLRVGVVSGNRIRNVYLRGRLAAVLRPSDGLFSLQLVGGEALHRCLAYPLRRVVVSDEAAPHVCRGSNVFAGHVVMVDSAVRMGDEVLVVDRRDSLLAVGKARLSAVEIYYFPRGEAVRVRKGACER